MNFSSRRIENTRLSSDRITNVISLGPSYSTIYQTGDKRLNQKTVSPKIYNGTKYFNPWNSYDKHPFSKNRIQKNQGNNPPKLPC